MKITVIFGGPGVGKSSWLANKYKELLTVYKPKDIVFVSYTRKQTSNGLKKVKKVTKKRYVQLKDSFRTVHSMSRQSYGTDTDVLDYVIVDRMSDFLQVDMTPVVRAIDYMKNVMSDNDAVGANRAGLDTKTFQKLKLFYNSVKEGYKKRGNAKIDYADMIEHAARFDYVSNAKVVMLDEVQDFSTLQWQAIYKVFRNVEEMYVAGDPNQALYRFSGGNSNYMFNIRCDETVMLSQSRRCCIQVMDMATLVWKQIKKSAEMPLPTRQNGFAVFSPSKPTKRLLSAFVKQQMLGQNIMVLANTYYQLLEVERMFLAVYPDLPHNFIAGRRKEYYHGKEKHPIIFSTVHQAKGLEAQYVLYDVSYGRSSSKFECTTGEDLFEDFWKTLYTGITRARQGIVLFQLSTPLAGEPNCLDVLYYANFGNKYYKRWLETK